MLVSQAITLGFRYKEACRKRDPELHEKTTEVVAGDDCCASALRYAHHHVLELDSIDAADVPRLNKDRRQ